MRRRIPLILVLASLIAAPTAGAVPPTAIEQTFHRLAPRFIDCGSFTVSGEWDVTRLNTIFYDSSGMPVRQTFHVHFSGTLTNNATGKSIPDTGNQNVTLDLLTGEGVVDGRVRVDTIPGEGVVLAQVGRVVTENGVPIFIAGQQAFAEHDLGGFCAFMASL